MSTDDHQWSERGRGGPVVRPYAITGGRVRPRNDDLEVEALITSSARSDLSPYLTYERRAIIRLCQQVQSVAEISARLEMPLGVVRVMIADMEGEGLVTVHRPSQLIGSHPDLTLLERVLYGLRNI